MKETGTTLWNTDPGSTNSSGFTALPGGTRFPNGAFLNIGSVAFFWSATESASNNYNNAFCFFLSENDGIVSPSNILKRFGISVRCLED